MEWGTSVDLSAPQCAPAASTKRQRLGSIGPPVESSVEVPVLDSKRFLFCEFFAGEGALTAVVTAAGVPVRSPDDLASGGIDFSDKSAVDALRREFEELAASGVKCMVGVLLSRQGLCFVDFLEIQDQMQKQGGQRN